MDNPNQDDTESSQETQPRVADLLAARASQFPRTASMIVTPDRMRRQNVPERVITTIDGLARTEPPWRDNYSAWKDRVDAAIVRRGQA
jgi:hypothetical protein